MRVTKEKHKPSEANGQPCFPQSLNYSHLWMDEWAPQCEKVPETGSFVDSCVYAPESPSTWWPDRESIKYVNYTYPRKKRRKRRKDESYADYIQFLKSFHHYGKRPFQPCIHGKRLTDADPHSVTFTRTVRSEVNWDEEFRGCLHHDRAKTYDHSKVKAQFADPVGDIDTGYSINDWWIETASESLIKEKLTILKQMSLDKMLPRLDDGFSIPRFIYELKDVKHMYHQYQDIFHNLDLMSGHVRQVLNQPISRVSSHFLAGIFGLLPMVQDIKTIVNKFRTAEDKVLDYLENEHVRRTLHYRKNLSPYTFRDVEDFESDSGHFDTGTIQNACGRYGDFPLIEFDCKTVHQIVRPRFHASLDFSYSLPGYLSAALKSFLSELDHWGINLSIGDFWDIIPFSFVIDWFADVGKWLHSFDFENVPATIKVNDYCWSISHQHVATSHLTNVTPGWSSLSPGRGNSQTSYHYYRFPDFPEIKPQHDFGVHLPRRFTIVLGAALLGSRYGRRIDDGTRNFIHRTIG